MTIPLTAQNLSRLSGKELHDAINASQWGRKSTRGFYESYFLRANHPTRPLAFWIRYTLFSPIGKPKNAEGQLWAIYFDGEASRQAAVKQPVPLADCFFSGTGLQVRMGASTLDDQRLTGAAQSRTHQLAWDMSYQGALQPSFLLPQSLCSGGFPKAKVFTGIPLADFAGLLRVDGQSVDVTGWRGSQNHNWGLKHTDCYAWGQVAGFDNAPDAFLECSTVRLKVGPLWTPWLTNLVLRLPGREIRLNTLSQALRNRGRYGYFHWVISCKSGPLQVEVKFSAAAKQFVALGYDDPPGGQRTCLNTKIAACEVAVIEPGKAPLLLTTKSRAAFEILALLDDHGLPLSA
jgi:hypothetical protein